MKKSQKGFGLPEVVLAAVTLGLVISLVWFVWEKQSRNIHLKDTYNYSGYIFPKLSAQYQVLDKVPSGSVKDATMPPSTPFIFFITTKTSTQIKNDARLICKNHGMKVFNDFYQNADNKGPSTEGVCEINSTDNSWQFIVEPASETIKHPFSDKIGESLQKINNLSSKQVLELSSYYSNTATGSD